MSQVKNLEVYKKELRDKRTIHEHIGGMKKLIQFISEAPKDFQKELVAECFKSTPFPLITIIHMKDCIIFVDLLTNKQISHEAKRDFIKQFKVKVEKGELIFCNGKTRLTKQISPSDADHTMYFVKAVYAIAEQIEGDANKVDFMRECLFSHGHEYSCREVFQLLGKKELAELEKLYPTSFEAMKKCSYYNLTDEADKIREIKRTTYSLAHQGKMIDARQILQEIVAIDNPKLQMDVAKYFAHEFESMFFSSDFFEKVQLLECPPEIKKLFLENAHFSENDQKWPCYVSGREKSLHNSIDELFKAVLFVAKDLGEEDAKDLLKNCFFKDKNGLKTVNTLLKNYENEVVGEENKEKYGDYFVKVYTLCRKIRIENIEFKDLEDPKDRAVKLLSMSDDTLNELRQKKYIIRPLQAHEVGAFVEEFFKKPELSTSEFNILFFYAQYANIAKMITVDSEKILRGLSEVYKKYEKHPEMEHFIVNIIHNYHIHGKVNFDKAINFITSAWDNKESKKGFSINIKNSITKRATGESTNLDRLKQKEKLLEIMNTQSFCTKEFGTKIAESSKNVESNIAKLEKDKPKEASKKDEIKENPKEAKKEKVQIKESKQEKEEAPIVTESAAVIESTASNTGIILDPSFNPSVSQLVQLDGTNNYFFYNAQSRTFIRATPVFVPENLQVTNIPQAPYGAQPSSQQSQVQQSMEPSSNMPQPPKNVFVAPPSYGEFQQLKAQQNMQVSVVKKEPHPATQEAEYEPFTAPSTSNLTYLRQLIEGQELSEPSKAYLKNAQNQIDALKPVETKKSEKPEVKVEQHAEVLTEKAKAPVSKEEVKKVKQEPKEPSSGVSETKTKTQEKKERVAVPS